MENIHRWYLEGFCKLFSKALTNTADPEIGVHATQAMTNLVPVIGSEVERVEEW